MWLLLLFVVLPAMELFLLIRIGGQLGVVPTVGLIIVTGMLGWMLAKSQGISTLRRIQSETAQGRLPAEEMVAGLCLLAAGLLLITPGFLTDTVGFLMLVPPLRRAVARRIMSRFRVNVMMGGPQGPQPGGPDIIDIPPNHVKTYATDSDERSA